MLHSIISAVFYWSKAVQGWTFGLGVKTPAKQPLSHIRTPGFDSQLCLPIPIFLPVQSLGERSGDDSRSWVLATHMGGLDWVPGYWLWLQPNAGYLRHLGVKQKLKFCISINKQINKKNSGACVETQWVKSLFGKPAFRFTALVQVLVFPLLIQFLLMYLGSLSLSLFSSIFIMLQISNSHEK